VTDCKTISVEEHIKNLDNHIVMLKESNRQKDKSNRTHQRQISGLQVKLQALKSSDKPQQTSWSKLFMVFSGSVIIGFGFSAGALGAYGWVKLLGAMIWE